MAIIIETNDLISIQQFAKELSMPRATVYRWAERGRVITIRLGGILFIPRSEVERLKDKSRSVD